MTLTQKKRNLLFMVGALLAIMALFQFVSYTLLLSTHELAEHKPKRRVGGTFGGRRHSTANATLQMPLPLPLPEAVVGTSLPSACKTTTGGLCTFFDITINSSRAGRIVFLLDANQRPKAAENFRALSTGEKGVSLSGTKLHYKGTRFSRVVSNILVQGGDIHGGGKAGEGEKESIYGAAFEHKGLDKFHKRGLLGMTGLERCGSNFFITLHDSVAQLDKKYAVLGKVVEGMDVVGKISVVKVSAVTVVIADSGQL